MMNQRKKTLLTDYSEYWIEYWVTPNGFVGPYYSWYDREKTKKHSFSCYNIEGEQHGLAKMWYEDGTLHTEQNYKDGEFQGVWRMWYEDGTPQFEDNYKDGKLHGVSKCWYYDGTLNYEHNYKDGKLHGVCKRWDKDGKIHRECNYEEGNCVSCVHGRC
jgi:antitoxin component YwqK of YwqJK toxin-antitoxin module